MTMTSLKIAAARASRVAAAVLGLALMVSAFAAPASAALDAPEVDPGSLASALTLLAGGIVTLTGRIRRAR